MFLHAVSSRECLKIKSDINLAVKNFVLKLLPCHNSCIGRDSLPYGSARDGSYENW